MNLGDIGCMVLNGGAVAFDSQRRKPLESSPRVNNESRSDGSSAVAARPSSWQWQTSHSPLRAAYRTVGYGMGLPSLTGIKKLVEINSPQSA